LPDSQGNTACSTCSQREFKKCTFTLSNKNKDNKQWFLFPRNANVTTLILEARRQGGEMTKTMYAHMNKRIKKKKEV
jgi:hypothetical protein